ncbi:glutathione S-transferase family protein [Dongia sp.]|uniref:glutathione S-transferase family protein n=1 Tax=Dongia sp. TaxID=1977262 RepID=UPI0035AE4098
MSLILYAHPFSSYCQKVLTALYENATPFTYRQLSPEDPAASSELAALWPLNRFPVLVDEGKTVLESSIIIEYLGLNHPGPVSLLPQGSAAALETRLMDRIFDNYVMTPMQRIVFDFIRPAESRDPLGVTQAREMLDRIYPWLDEKMKDRPWAAGDMFSLADCAAAPALFYADWTHPIDAGLKCLRAYRARLLARPSFARAVEEARPFRAFFPPGAPDRD